MNVTVSYLSPQPGNSLVYLVVSDPPGPAGYVDRADIIGVHVICAFEDEAAAARLAGSWTRNRTPAQVIPVMLCPPGTELTA